jgi:ral guanine nucleotide dissociation stimulator-like 1
MALLRYRPNLQKGTARFADTVGENDHHMQKILQKHSENSRAISYGTIPYLGTFLTDLTMIDTAIPDVHSDGLINFDKRRKEFEVLAQIKLLQGAANAYHIETDRRFNQWFETVLLLDEKEAFDLSCKMEPAGGVNGTTPASKDNRYKKKSNGVYHRKNDSIASTASSSSGSQFYETDGSLPSSAAATPLKQTALGAADDENKSPLRRGSAGGDGSGRWSSTHSSATSNNGATSVDSGSNVVRSEPNPEPTTKRPSTAAKSETSASDRVLSKASSSSSLTKPTADSPYKTSEFYIIRVSINSSGPETEGIIMYKSIMIGNHERTREVIRNAMMKHGLEGSPDNYTLSQVLSDKELLIPSNANVYYAVNTQHDLNFALRERHEDLLTSLGGQETAVDSGSQLQFTPLSGLRKGSRDTSKARRKLLGLQL